MEQFARESRERRMFAGDIAIIGALVLGSAGLALNVHAAVVDTGVDGSVPGHCTLRDAVLTGTLEAPVAGCEWSGDTPNQIVFNGVSEVTLTSAAGGTLLVTTPTFIISEESAVTIRRLEDDAPFRLIESTAEDLALIQIRLEGGKVEGPGAAVLGQKVDIRYSTISGNSAGMNPDASVVYGDEVLLEGSSLADNDAWTGVSAGLACSGLSAELCGSVFAAGGSHRPIDVRIGLSDTLLPRTVEDRPRFLAHGWSEGLTFFWQPFTGAHTVLPA